MSEKIKDAAAPAASNEPDQSTPAAVAAPPVASPPVVATIEAAPSISTRDWRVDRARDVNEFLAALDTYVERTIQRARDGFGHEFDTETPRKKLFQVLTDGLPEELYRARRV